MSNLTIFNFENSSIQTIVENNEVFFRAAQLAELLQYSNPHKAIKDHVDQDDLTKREVIDTVKRRQQVWFVNESGMYALILGSKLESAKKVKRWITSEVLPQIRKTGRYEQQQQLALPEPPRERTYTHTLKESFWRNLAWLWYEAHQENELIARVLPGLEAIASKHAPTAYSQKVEYGNHIRFMADQIYSLVKDIPFEHSYAPLRALEAVMQTKQTKRIYR